MTDPARNFLRGLSLAAILMASSCAGPSDGSNPGFEDGARNNPIAIEPSYQSLKLAYSPADQGLSPQDAAQFPGNSWPDIWVTATAPSPSARRRG